MSSDRIVGDDDGRTGAGALRPGDMSAGAARGTNAIVNYESGKDQKMPPMSITGGAIMLAARPVARRADYGVSTILDTIVTRRRPSVWRRVMRVFRKR